MYILQYNILSFINKEDVPLFTWLYDAAPFAGIGTHKLALHNTLLLKSKTLTQNSALYRNTIQFLICEDGFIHFVDRVLSENLNIALTNGYKITRK